MPSIPNYLAGNQDGGSWEPTYLFSGDKDVHTDGGVCGANFPMYSVLAVDANGLLVPHDPTGTGTVATARFIAAQAGTAGQKTPYYTSGQFNPDALVWHSSLTTFEQRQAAFRGQPIMIKAIY